MLLRRTSIPLSLNHSFAIYQKSDFNLSKTHLISPFMVFSPDTRGSVKFYRNTSQILWLLPFAHLGDKLWPVTKVSKDLA